MRLRFLLLLLVSTALAGADASAAPSSDARARQSRHARQATLGEQAPRRLLHNMNRAIARAGKLFPGPAPGCAQILPLLTTVPRTPRLAGQFSDGAGSCYVWLNIATTASMTDSDLCKLVVHETGHLHGLGHSPDPKDLMFAPYRVKPLPPVCQGF